MDERRGWGGGGGDGVTVMVIEEDTGVSVTERMWGKCSPLDRLHPLQLTKRNALAFVISTPLDLRVQVFMDLRPGPGTGIG